MHELQMVDVDFGKDVEAEIECYIEQQLNWLITSHTELHKTRRK